MLLAILNTIITLIAGELSFWLPEYFYYILGSANILLIIVSWFLLGKNIIGRRFPFLVSFCLLLNALLAYLSFQEKAWLVHILIIISAFLQGWYAVNAFNFSKQGIVKKGYLLKTLYYHNFLYGLQSFLHIPLWLILGLAVVVVSVLNFSLFYFNSNEEEASWRLAFLMMLIIIQSWGIIALLPFHYNILGFLALLVYYFVTGLALLFLYGEGTKKKLRLYLSLGILLFLFVILITKWL
jgi:hypothetical protein